MGGGGGSSESGEPEFQIAPMIDVLLVLLIFFMSITSAQVLQIDKDITLPVAADAKKKEDKDQMNEGAVNIAWDVRKQESSVRFGGREYETMEPLVEQLTKLKAKNPKYRIIIRADRTTPAVEVQKAMGAIANAGIDDISFSALNQD
jgi:biopolymer transport protein ExbD